MNPPFGSAYRLILDELDSSLASIDPEEIEGLLAAIRQARGIFVVGAGRMGILLSTFAMRLNHLGFACHIVGSATCPPVSPADLLLVASSSGETATVREVVDRAAKQRAAVAAITAAPASTIGKAASRIVKIQAASSLDAPCTAGAGSGQPMKTLFEQTLFVLLEALVLMLLERTGQSASDMARRHANLE